MRAWGEKAIWRQPDNVTIGDDRYRFFININEYPEKLAGLLFEDYISCLEYELSNDIRSYLTAHVG